MRGEGGGGPWPERTAASEAEALRGARDGDTEAGRVLLQVHGPSMVRTAWRVLGRYGGLDAEDVVQEAFVAALTTQALPHGDVGAWLRSIVARKALDALRRKSRRAEQSLSETQETDPALIGTHGATRHDDALTLRKVLGRLSPLDRAILVLADVEGRSMAEVADALGSTRVAVKLRASRARRKLKRWMQEDTGEST